MRRQQDQRPHSDGGPFAIPCEVRVDAIGQSPSSLCRAVKVRPSAFDLESEVDSWCDADPSVGVVEPHLTSDRKTSRSCHSQQVHFGLFKHLAARARVSLDCNAPETRATSGGDSKAKHRRNINQ